MAHYTSRDIGRARRWRRPTVDDRGQALQNARLSECCCFWPSCLYLWGCLPAHSTYPCCLALLVHARDLPFFLPGGPVIWAPPSCLPCGAIWPVRLCILPCLMGYLVQPRLFCLQDLGLVLACLPSDHLSVTMDLPTYLFSGVVFFFATKHDTWLIMDASTCFAT